MLRLKEKPITNSHNRTYLNESINLASSSKCSSHLSISPEQSISSSNKSIIEHNCNIQYNKL